MTVSIQTAILHGHYQNSITEPRQKCDANFCQLCGAWFQKAEKENPDVAKERYADL